MFDIGDGAVRIYIRYSRLHDRGQAFYGLRKVDLQRLAGHTAFVCFLWDEQEQPLCVPFCEYEELFGGLEPAADGQHKVQVYTGTSLTELYVANAGRFNVESHIGWGAIQAAAAYAGVTIPDLSHSQVQTLLGAIGSTQGFGIWVPPRDRHNLDWSLVGKFDCDFGLPPSLDPIRHVVEEIDVVWLNRGGATVDALFEVEHSTPVYSGLLRFNDVHLTAPRLPTKFTIVSNESRRSLFVRQVNRPTFSSSGLSQLCSFLEYRNVFDWYTRITATEKSS